MSVISHPIEVRADKGKCLTLADLEEFAARLKAAGAKPDTKVAGTVAIKGSWLKSLKASAAQ